MLEESLHVALAAGEVDHACRAYVNTSWRLLDDLCPGAARRQLLEAVALAEESEHLGFLGYIQLGCALADFATGAWDNALNEAAVEREQELPVTRSGFLTVAGRIHVRRGQDDGSRLLEHALELAEPVGELQRTGMIAAGLAEAAWLRGDLDATGRHAGAAYAFACRAGHVRLREELGYWLAKAGHPVTPVAVDHPYALQVNGRWREAADLWKASGHPYEYAAALADSDQPDPLLTALDVLDELGGGPLSRFVRARLRAHGVRRVPRGPIPATRRNPAGLTPRQVEVAQRLVRGLTNAEIAAELYVSVRTVDHHVAAVLGKLGAGSRREVRRRAIALDVPLEEEG
ncbi:helix-turn-helix transcriptional regulator [Streptomyces sp. 2A115]|uniref:helix-turn-helix transcriptional regulator n=1 Tax=Streptomyces sp. 2A115 TaxID=3457439 RepID=UPI003FD32BBA